METVPPFDALRGEGGPTALFGRLLRGAEAERALAALETAAVAATERTEATFGPSSERDPIERLDSLIAEMWSTGWSPARNDLNLFARDLGAILAAALMASPGAQPVFRSASVLDHFSVFYAVQELEVFPFHKVAKALAARHGESLAQLLRATAHVS